MTHNTASKEPNADDVIINKGVEGTTTDKKPTDQEYHLCGADEKKVFGFESLSFSTESRLSYRKAFS